MLLLFYFLMGRFLYGVLSAQNISDINNNEKFSINSVLPNRTTVPCYGKFELTVNLTAVYDNPFDPTQIRLEAEFFPPTGKKTIVAGFFYQEYKNKNNGDDNTKPHLEAIGKPCWKIRFSPTIPGTYNYIISLRNRDREIKWGPEQLNCTKSPAHGFIRVSSLNRRYFKFDDGTSYFPVAQNLQQDWIIYKHSHLLIKNGANSVRIWVARMLEWIAHKKGKALSGEFLGNKDAIAGNAGIGRYNLINAWILDRYLERCAQDNLYIMICLNSVGELRNRSNRPNSGWLANPYNLINGGPITEPKDFWTDQTAKRLYKQFLRYAAARWGYSKNIWAWEFWNEVGDTKKRIPEIARWHQEMTEYLRTADPNRHLISTSTWRLESQFAPVWDLAKMDFTQSHIYSPLAVLRWRIHANLNRWQSPHVVGEGWAPLQMAKDPGVDPEGIGLHNVLWASVMSGAASTTLPWWWRQRIEPNNLFFHYQAISNFVKDIGWADSKFIPLDAEIISSRSGNNELAPVLIPSLRPNAVSSGKCFVIQENGVLADNQHFPDKLYATVWRSKYPLNFKVNYQAPGLFIVKLKSAKQCEFNISVDGQSILRREFKTPESYKYFSVKIPSGQHTVTLSNVSSTGRIEVYFIMLTNYRDRKKYPDIELWGLQSDSLILLWAHNRLNQWPFRERGFMPGSVGPSLAKIKGVKSGNWSAEWWDTYKGIIIKENKLKWQNNCLLLPIPTFQKDIACKLRRLSH